MEYGILNAMHIAHKFEHLLNIYRRPDGHPWTGQQLNEATSGVVSRSYVTNLRKGRIKGPGYENRPQAMPSGREACLRTPPF
jgi:hypothetical protein